MMKDQYNESLMLLLHKINRLEQERTTIKRNTADWIEISSRIAGLKNMLDDVYIQANGAKQYDSLWNGDNIE